MKRSVLQLAAAAMVVFLAQCSPSATTAPSADASPSNAAFAAVGSVAPAFTGTSLEGTKVASSDYAGKVLVLNFWATWCPPCRLETPDMIASYGRLHADDVAFLGLDTSEGPDIVRTFTSIRGVPYPTAIGSAADYNSFGVSALPTTIVLDGKGVVRGRWLGPISPARLASYVADARAGRNATYETPEQKKIDALIGAGKLDAAQKYIASLTVDYDYEKTQMELGAAELKAAKTPLDRANAYGDLNRFADAAAIYTSLLAKKPNDAKLTGLLTRAYYRLHDYPAMARAAARWTKLAPNDADAWDNAGLAQERAKNFAAAAAPYEKAVALLKKDADTQPIGKDGAAVAFVADEAMDLADVYVALGDAKNAKRVFALSQSYADKIPPNGRYKAMIARVPERTTEGMAAVAMAHGGGPNVSLTKWTGPDLPGSLKSTLKYRLVVVGSPDAKVALSAKGLKPGWVASFCADGLCSPGGVKVALPGIGAKTYEFQLVPPKNGESPGKVWVLADGKPAVAVPV